MKVVYLIYNNTNGLGGHYRSLKSLLEQWDGFNLKWEVFFLGKSISPIYENLKNVSFIESTCFGIREIFKLYRKFLNEKPDIIHCYDSTSYFIGRSLSWLMNIPIIYTKCGGKNEMYVPKSCITVLFSQENYHYLKSNKGIEYYVIPNRVNKPFFDNELLIKFGNVVKGQGKDYVVMRIGNIVDSYANSIEASFRLALELESSTESSVLLVVIGKEFDNTLIKLRNKFPKVNCLLLDTLDYTKDASRLLFAADYVVGTGRGAMEALLVNKPVFIYSKNETLPLRVTSENFEEFLNYNFSERSKVSSHRELIKSACEIEDLFKLSEQAFLAKIGNEKVESIYNGMLKNSRRIFFGFDYFQNWLRYMRVNRFFKRSRN